MRFSSRSAMSTLLSLAVMLTLASAFTVSGFLDRHSAHAAATAATYQGARGTALAVKTVNATNVPSGKAPNRVAKTTPLRSHATSAKAAGGATGSAVPFAPARLLRSFNGVDEITNQATSNTPVEPPDEGLAVGNGYVLNIVNLTGAFYHLNGTLAAAPFSVPAFFGLPPAFTAGTVTSDPRAYYDKATNTWFIIVWSYDDGSVSKKPSSHIYVATNSSGNPLSTYKIYSIDTTDPTGYNCPCFPDYTIFGIDQYNVYLSGQEFSIANQAANTNGAEIYAVSKSQLKAGANANYVRFGSLSVAGTIAYHVQPAISYGNPNAEYFENSLDPNSTFDNRIAVWALTNRQSVTTGVGLPNLSTTVINSEAYGFPVNAVTPPGFNSYTKTSTTGVVTPDFDAMQEVEYINGHLVSSLDTAITIPGDTGERDGIAWFQIQPRLSGSVISAATAVSSQGYIASQGNYLLYPHIEQSRNGTTAITFSLGGPNTYLSAAYAVKSAGSANFGAIQLAGAGVAPDNGFTSTARFGGVGRWGDYSAGQLDPNSSNIWFATQYIPNNGDQYANWGNRVFEVAA